MSLSNEISILEFMDIYRKECLLKHSCIPKTERNKIILQKVLKIISNKEVQGYNQRLDFYSHSTNDKWGEYEMRDYVFLMLLICVDVWIVYLAIVFVCFVCI